MLSTAWRASAILAAPALTIMLRRRAAHGKELPDRLPERKGIDPTTRPPGRLLWIHAASVGEATSVLPVLDELSGLNVLFTTGTVTSARLVAERAPGVMHRFVPLDVPGWIGRFLDHWRPDAAAFVESELWPNTIAACGRRGIRLMLVNARMSARSARGWSWAPGLAADMLRRFDRVYAQSAADAARLEAMGAEHVVSAGDLKFSAQPLPADPTALAALRSAIGARPVWLAASTHDGEEAIIRQAADTLARNHAGLLTIVAPRHPARGAAAADMLGGAPRRSAGADPDGAQFYVADTVGELGLFYRAAPLVLMGKSMIAPGGGQNPLEPARLGCALAAGPHTANVAASTEALARAGGLTRVADAASLAGWAGHMLADPQARDAAAQAALRTAHADSDLPRRIAAELTALACG